MLGKVELHRRSELSLGAAGMGDLSAASGSFRGFLL